MGSDSFYEEERPAHWATVADAWIERHPVTVEQFARFVAQTGYVTVAERPTDPRMFPWVDPRALVPGSLVFTPPSAPVPLNDVRAWWSYVPGACWRAPEGPGSTVRGRERHPVTHVAHEDARRYAAWAGRRLPTEAEWERAARGGLEGAAFAWGEEDHSLQRPLANTFRGRFPWCCSGPGRRAGTSPVGAYPANGYGLLDVTGNVWEWTGDAFAPRHHAAPARRCCDPAPATGAGAAGTAQVVVKGGSHLCSPDYCLRYRPAARQGMTPDTSSSHVGFRCALTPA